MNHSECRQEEDKYSGLLGRKHELRDEKNLQDFFVRDQDNQHQVLKKEESLVHPHGHAQWQGQIAAIHEIPCKKTSHSMQINSKADWPKQTCQLVAPFLCFFVFLCCSSMKHGS